MIGFIKYKLFKWLWSDICRKINCEDCPMTDVCKCEKCGNYCAACYDVEDSMYKTARRAWKVE